MKRLRWILAVMTLVLVALDCLSSWRQFGLHIASDASARRDYFGVICTSGALKLIRLDATEAALIVPRSSWRWEVPAQERNPLAIGFSRDSLGTTIEFPIWPITFTIGILGLKAWRSHRSAARKDNCRHCGYDLTGNTSGVCPECGQMVRNAPHT